MDINWDDVETQQKTAKAPVDAHDQYEEVYEEVYEDEYVDEIVDESDPDDNPAVVEAIKRIEQAKLYESLLKHDFFAPGSARHEIQDKVTREIRGFILERLSELVGMTTPKTQTAPAAELPWDTEQVEALTSLANRLLEKKASPQKPAQPTVRQFGAHVSEPSVNVVPAPQESQSQQKTQKKKIVKRVVRREPPQAKTNHNLPAGTKVDPKTGNPIAESGAVLYPGQVTNKKNPPKPMPTQREQDMMNARSVNQASAARGQSGDLGSQILQAAILSAQATNANIIEEDV